MPAGPCGIKENIKAWNSRVELVCYSSRWLRQPQ